MERHFGSATMGGIDVLLWLIILAGVGIGPFLVHRLLIRKDKDMPLGLKILLYVLGVILLGLPIGIAVFYALFTLLYAG